MSPGIRRFAVTCKSCGRVLFAVTQISEPEIAVLVEHLAQCAPRVRLAAPLGEVLQHFRVAQAAG
jgi:hypothetical protein